MKDNSFEINKPPSPYPTDPRPSFHKEEVVIRTPDELDRVLKEKEGRKITTDIVDERGKKLCVIDYDPSNGDVIAIHSETYFNTDSKAEHLEEKTYVTDENGNITNDRLTRAQAREQGKRYLIVTNLLFHGDSMLVQKRSPNKQIDPSKVSASAHGVAKQIFAKDGSLITDAQIVALINTALEINEELRHGINPFLVKIWPGTHDELYSWSEQDKKDDPDTIWIVPELYLEDNGYPLHTTKDKRTRALSAGFIFSKEEPSISIDPSELEEYRWEKTSKVFREPDSTQDLYSTTTAVLEELLKDSPLVRKYGQKLAQNAMRRWQGLEVDRP